MTWKVRAEIGRFVENYVTTPIEVCEQRGVKGLYKKARQGIIREMTGVDDLYEVPENPEIQVDTVNRTPADSAEYVLSEFDRLGMPNHPE